MAIRMTALRSFSYAGRRVAIGTEFDARSRNDAKVLAASRRASYVEVGDRVRETANFDLPPAQRGARSRAARSVVVPAPAPDTGVAVIGDQQDVVDPNAGTDVDPNAGSEVSEADKPARRAYRRRDMTADPE